MKKVVFTVEEFNGKNNAGPKAKKDVDTFLAKENFKIIHQKFNVHSKIDKLKDAYWTIPHLLNGEKEIDELYFQYPTYSSFLMKRLVKRLKLKSQKLFFIIHDVESLRMFQNNATYWQSERELFNSSDGLIVHNQQMKKWLAEHGVEVPMVILGVFDYDNPQPIQKDLSYSKKVCFAGNLSKSGFLEKLSLGNSSLDIYGSNPANKYLEGVAYKGQMTPEKLPKALVQNFGLVWDGEELTTCKGKFGNYMKYNNPHKVSLYLSTGLPIIIWKQAALAEFVCKEKIGIAVESLGNLDDILNNINEDEYRKYKLNAMKLASKLREGYFIKQAVQKISEISN